jgi:signal transduction histidine kinase
MRRYQERVQNIITSSNLQGGPLYVKGDLSQLTQVFMNLILNAEEALRECNGGNILITTQIDWEWAKVSIADDGTGIPEENLNQVFHPFFTTKKVGEGTGLGLSTCYGVITAHDGLIYAENNEMNGATFTVELPLAKTRRQGSLGRETEKASLVTI